MTRVFFSFIIISQLRWPIELKFSQVCYYLCICLDTPSEKTGLWQLPMVSTVFKHRCNDNKNTVIFFQQSYYLPSLPPWISMKLDNSLNCLPQKHESVIHPSIITVVTCFCQNKQEYSWIELEVTGQWDFSSRHSNFTFSLLIKYIFIGIILYMGVRQRVICPKHIF